MLPLGSQRDERVKNKNPKTIASSKRQMKKAEVLSRARATLPFPDIESYRLLFKSGVWEVWNNGSTLSHWKVIKIRDADGKVLSVEKAV
jgi:hypothetical protein